MEETIPEQWLWALQMPTDTDFCYVRYIGQCTSPTTPWQRYREDLDRPSGHIRNFFDILEDVATSQEYSCQVLEFLQARLPPGRPQTEADEIERLLIAFFGLSPCSIAKPAGFTLLSHHQLTTWK